MECLNDEFDKINNQPNYDISHMNRVNPLLYELLSLYIEDSGLVNYIIDYIRKIIEKHINKDITSVIQIVNDRIKFYELDDNKIKILKYKDSILHYFKENDIFQYYYEMYNSLFNPRINQSDAFNKIDKRIETGIHCQATGCGKSYIILYYINSIQKKYGNKSNIILFTERIDILKDMFDFGSHDKINKWKKMGIVDLTNTKIINRVTIKERNWINEFNDTQPCLLVINRAYLTSSDYKSLDNINIVLHDECHNTPSAKCFEFLEYMKHKDVPIIGFSATPIRSNLNELERIKEIYSINDKIHLLTDYNMIHSISENLILAPEFYWYYYDVNVEESILNELIHILPRLFYKKIIIWCQTIKNTKAWKQIFKTFVEECDELSNFKLYIDTCKDVSNDYDEFYKSKENSILFCATKHREGSDIPYLDGCLFADKVKKRGMIPFLQSIGRVLRLAPNKKRGIIMEGIIKNTNYSEDITNKIIDYYWSMYNSCTDNESRIVKLKDLLKHLHFNETNHKIYLNVSDKYPICINIEPKYWDGLSENIKLNVDKRIKSMNHCERDVIYTKSRIIKCIINDIELEKKNYKKVIECIYLIINDYDKISKDITWTKKGIYNEHGYKYFDKIDISIQGQDANTCMREILKKCKENHIRIYMEIELADKTICTINS